jgi:hypothetical protein
MSQLDNQLIAHKLYERQLKTGHQTTKNFKGLTFIYKKIDIEVTVFTHKEIKQIPISRINNKPMKRIKAKALKELLVILGSSL